MSEPWRVRLAASAEADLLDIAAWTAERFGSRQAGYYVDTVTQAIEALREGPDILGAKARDDIAPGIRTLHVARQGRKGRHFVMFRVAPGRVIEVLRLLHDSMDLSRHWPNDDAEIQ
ncbi:type II toxin-antitoxin system RelE/ParE family toxin [Tepidicella xavieri]|uniref:Toxin ParE1/3/4 n=1 Tax=Tepidicella xavieri TaxID=360241 RepID=A0A4R6TX89_9BURK|nr:type II toxin-antitoxin system RelE/ParE family toxin [Tepidicella xavieri]TDQ37906.1 toxin ParE1/3/4 [Tepidicella xavieri]